MKHPELRPAIIWETHEYLFQEKTNDWYWGVAIIALSAAVIAIIFGEILLALLIIIGSFTLCLVGARRPNVVRYEINNTGVLIENILYPYATLSSFWVENNSHMGIPSKVIFKSRKIVSPFLVLHIEDIDPELMRDFLLDHLPEAEHSEPLSQKLLEYFGF